MIKAYFSEHDHKNAVLCRRYDHPHIMAGQGTMGLEIVEQVNNIDVVIVPVGGGGLIAGVALAVKTLHPRIKIIVSNICAQLLQIR